MAVVCEEAGDHGEIMVLLNSWACSTVVAMARLMWLVFPSCCKTADGSTEKPSQKRLKLSPASSGQ